MGRRAAETGASAQREGERERDTHTETHRQQNRDTTRHAQWSTYHHAQVHAMCTCMHPIGSCACVHAACLCIGLPSGNMLIAAHDTRGSDVADRDVCLLVAHACHVHACDLCVMCCSCMHVSDVAPLSLSLSLSLPACRNVLVPPPNMNTRL